MLIVKAPIELKCRSDMIPSYEAFAQRIAGNYRLLQTPIDGEDLLHAVTEPPEIYLAEGSVSTTVNMTTIHNRQENKLEILNQLLNRITMESGLHMTYQDKVYITDVLHRLGIRNTQQFMRQLFLLKEETHNTTELVDHYWNHMEELRELIQSYREHREERLEQNEYRTEQNGLHLHQDIMNRLQTGSIYQIVSNFNQSRAMSAAYIDSDELKLFEYYRINRNILLNTLENDVRGENKPLIYRHENYYEELLPAGEEVTQENITRQITAAVLLQLADNLYQNRNETVNRQKNTWYTMSQAFFRSAGNTMNRLYRNLVQEFDYSRRAGDYLQQLNKSYRQELSLLEQLFQAEGGAAALPPSPKKPGDVVLQTLEHYDGQQTNEYHEDSAEYREGDHYRTQQDFRELQQNYRQDVTRQELSLDARQQLTQENMQQLQEQTDITVEQLEQFHRHNIENRNKYIQALERIQQQEVQRKPDSIQRMQRDGLLALKNPQEVLRQLETENRQRQEQAEQTRQKELALLPQETQQIYELLEQYMQLPERQLQAEAATNRSISSLQRDIETVERERVSQQLSETQTERQLRELAFLTNEPPKNYEAPGQPQQAAGEPQTERITDRSVNELVLDRETVESERLSETQYHTSTQKQLQRLSETLERENTSERFSETQTERQLQELTLLTQEPSGRYGTYGQPQRTAGEPQTERITDRSVNELVLDRETVESERLSDTQHHTRTEKQLQQLTETVVERWQENAARKQARTRVTEKEEQSRTTLVHRLRTDNELNEEIAEQLMNQSRVLERQTKVIEEVTHNSATVERKVTNRTTHEINEQADNITELINRGVQGRIGEITDQVYSRLERRLQNERRRRGY